MVLVPRGFEDQVDVQGKIALVSIRLPHEQTIRNLQNRGAIAVVMGGFTGQLVLLHHIRKTCLTKFD